MQIFETKLSKLLFDTEKFKLNFVVKKILILNIIYV